MPDQIPGALRALLAEIVDYAGLFPPAGLGMADAVARFAAYQADPDRWMLARFVVPAARLDEFGEVAAPLLRRGARWRLSALVGPETEADLARVAEFNCGPLSDEATVDAIEAKAATPAGIERLAAALPLGVPTFVELPLSAGVAPLVEAIGAARLNAKVRTGGVTAEAFPATRALAHFLAACARARVPFKATAGLHHPLRAEHPLTYAPDSARCTMFGYLNLFVAAVLLHDGLPEEEAASLLEERDARAFAFDDDALRWRDHAVPTRRIAEARTHFALSFGSCSFREPVDEMRAMLE